MANQLITRMADARPASRQWNTGKPMKIHSFPKAAQSRRITIVGDQPVIAYNDPVASLYQSVRDINIFRGRRTARLESANFNKCLSAEQYVSGDKIFRSTVFEPVSVEVRCRVITTDRVCGVSGDNRPANGVSIYSLRFRHECRNPGNFCHTVRVDTGNVLTLSSSNPCIARGARALITLPDNRKKTVPSLAKRLRLRRGFVS